MNKRVCLAAVTALVLCLCGCTHETTTQPITDGFTGQVSATYREMEVGGTIHCTEDGKMTLSFSLPKSLQGVTLGWDGEEMTMALGKMEMTIPEDKVPQGALVRCLLQALSATHPDGSETEAGYVVEGQADGVSYTLVCDPDSGLPLSLTVPSEELTATFTDLTRIQ